MVLIIQDSWMDRQNKLWKSTTVEEEDEDALIFRYVKKCLPCQTYATELARIAYKV
jgi:hypothetical protein